MEVSIEDSQPPSPSCASSVVSELAIAPINDEHVVGEKIAAMVCETFVG
jgi:hypothetical protein